MSIASEITRLYGVRGDILQAIAAKGVTVPGSSKLADCPGLIAAITAPPLSIGNLTPVEPVTGIYIVDETGYIGYNITGCLESARPATYCFALVSPGSDFSSAGLGQVTFYSRGGSTTIGGKTYRTTFIAGHEWLAENLDYNFDGLYFGKNGTSTTEPRGNYWRNDQATYGSLGIVYNWVAAKYLNDNAATLIPGWHVPSHDEYLALANAVGGYGVAGTHLKSTTAWGGSANGDGLTAFGAVPVGDYNGNWGGEGTRTFFWTATEYEDNPTNYARLERLDTSSYVSYTYDYKEKQVSLRLIRNYQ